MLPLILRKEHRLRVFKNRVMRRIFGPKREKMMGGWRRLYTEDLHNLYVMPSIIKSCPSALTENHAMKACWGNVGIAPLIL
jgi:hypothetical protein